MSHFFDPARQVTSQLSDGGESRSFIRPAETGEDVSAPSAYNPNRSAMR